VIQAMQDRTGSDPLMVWQQMPMGLPLSRDRGKRLRNQRIYHDAQMADKGTNTPHNDLNGLKSQR
jgi:hypothetical protein